MSNKKMLLLYLTIRYLTILLLILLLVGAYKIEVYGMVITIYYVAINYLAIKYGIIYEIDKNEKIEKKDLFNVISFLMVIVSVVTYIVYKFSVFETIIFSIIPVIEFYFMKTKKEKQMIIDSNTKKTIDNYFKNKK